MTKQVFSRIAGTGSYLPEKVLTNDDLAKFVETSDEWIAARTGIRERRMSPDTYRMLLRLAEAPDTPTLIELGLTHSKKAFPAPEVPKHADIRKGWY